MIKPKAAHVDIYRSSAILKLQATAQLSEGENLIYILWDRISSDIRLKFTDAIDSVRILGKATVAASKKDYSDRRNKLADEAERFSNRRKILIQQAEQLTDLLNVSALQNVSIEDAVNYLTNTKPKMIQKIFDELHEIQNKLAEIKKELNNIEYEEKSEQYAALCVMVNSSIEGEAPFEIIYEDRTVGWEPFYEIHMDDETKPLRFCLRANITRAHLCEEWKDVSVCLFGESTQQYNEIPVLIPKHLQYMEEKKERKKVIETNDSLGQMPPVPSMDCATSYLLDAVETTLTSDTSVFDDVVLEERVYDADMHTEIAACFELPGTWTFPEVGNEMKIDIQRFTLPGIYRYYAVPKSSTNVYLTAELEETDVEHILACRADLYVKDVMIGSCMLDPQSAAHRYRLSLGKDAKVYAARKQTKNQHYVNRQGKKRKDICEYRIILQNRKSRDLTIQAADQIPISDNSRITVVQEELSGGFYNRENGEVTWNVNVKAKSTAEIILRYSVIYTI